MRINVGPFAYQVKLVHGYIEHEGQCCFGLCDNLQQRILLSDVPPEAQRLQVFFHELMHAWWYHFGPDSGDEEAVVDLVGIAMTEFLMQAGSIFPAAQPLGALNAARGCEPSSSPSTAHAPAYLPESKCLDDSDVGSSGSSATGSETASSESKLMPTAAFADEGWSVRIYSPTMAAVSAADD